MWQVKDIEAPADMGLAIRECLLARVRPDDPGEGKERFVLCDKEGRYVWCKSMVCSQSHVPEAYCHGDYLHCPCCHQRLPQRAERWPRGNTIACMFCEQEMRLP